MKNTDWKLLFGAAAYSFLFYSQSAGVNFLLFTLLLVGLLVKETSKETMRHTSWRLTALASVGTALSIVVVNSSLAVLANIISLLLLAVFSKAPSSSVFMAAVHAVYSMVVSAVKAVQTKVQDQEGQQTPAFSFWALGRQHLFMVGVPMAVFFVFLMLYRNSSAAFAHMLDYINFDFISVPWLLFTFTGGWLLVGFFRPMLVEKLAALDEAAPNRLYRTRRSLRKLTKILTLKYEYKTSFLLLVLLNVLILVFILSDSYYLTFGTLPTDVPFSDYLHQGVNTLIFSILMAIGVLLVVFRENLNFYQNTRTLKLLAYVWLAQNLILVLITCSKNTLYIAEFGLTYKRIGVYTYLLLTAIGLVFSYLKVWKIKTNWYLFRKNAWAVYLVLVVASFFNWDRLITHYNLTYSPKPDVSYLLWLSDSNLSLLYAQTQESQNPFTASQTAQIQYWRKNFLADVANQDWRSWNFNDWRVAKELQQAGKN